MSDCTGTDVGTYVDAVFDLFLGRISHPSDQIAVVRQGGHRRPQVPDERAVGLRRVGRRPDRRPLRAGARTGRRTPPGGPAGWPRSASGKQLEDIAPGFYGSEEYFNKVGRTNSGYVDRLYVDILGRQADAGGRANWIRSLDSGQRSRRDVAVLFLRSEESRRDRVIAQYRAILVPGPRASGPELLARCRC